MFERVRKALSRRKKQQSRTLPKQLQAPDLPAVITVDMHDNHDGTFIITPNVEQLEARGIIFESADTNNGNPPNTFTVVDFKPSNDAPSLPKELWGVPSSYGRTETGEDVLRHNQEEFRGAKQAAIDEEVWLDEQGVDFTRWEFALTPDRKHIASASIYLHDPSTVAELVYDAAQKYLPGCAGNYIRYRDPRGVIDDADLTVEIPNSDEILYVTGRRVDKAFLKWTIELNKARGCLYNEAPLFTNEKMRELFSHLNKNIPERKYWHSLDD